MASTNTFRYEIATANAGCRMEMEPEVQSARTKSGATSKTAGGVSSDPFGKVFRPRLLAEMWQLSENSIRRLFQDEPGVFCLGESNPRGGRRGYVTLRIPESVAMRVWRERTQKPGKRIEGPEANETGRGLFVRVPLEIPL